MQSDPAEEPPTLRRPGDVPEPRPRPLGSGPGSPRDPLPPSRAVPCVGLPTASRGLSSRLSLQRHLERSIPSLHSADHQACPRPPFLSSAPVAQCQGCEHGSEETSQPLASVADVRLCQAGVQLREPGQPAARDADRRRGTAVGAGWAGAQGGNGGVVADPKSTPDRVRAPQTRVRLAGQDGQHARPPRLSGRRTHSRAARTRLWHTEPGRTHMPGGRGDQRPQDPLPCEDETHSPGARGRLGG